MKRSEIRQAIGEHCTDEIENAIMALYLRDVDPLKDEVEKLKQTAERAKELESKVTEFEKGDYKSRYEKEHAEFDAFRKKVEAEKTESARTAAVKAYFEKKGITGENLKIAMLGAKAQTDAVELDGEKIKDTKALDELVNGTFKGLIVQTSEQGVKVPSPATGISGDYDNMSDADYYRMTYEKRS